MSSADSRPDVAQPDESAFWQDLRDDLKDPEFREAFVAESERLTADDARTDPATCDHETVILVPSDEGFPGDGWLCATCSTPFVPLQIDGTGAAE